MKKSSHSRAPSQTAPSPLPTLTGLLPATVGILTIPAANLIRPFLPSLLQHANFKLLYSMDQHGTSLQTLLHSIIAPCVVVIKDGGIYGGFMNEFYETKGFFGNGQCFLWELTDVRSRANSSTSASPSKNSPSIPGISGGLLSPTGHHPLGIKAYLSSGTNEFYISTHGSTVLSMGDGPGLLVDEHFNVSSAKSECFGSSGFGARAAVEGIEIWGLEM